MRGLLQHLSAVLPKLFFTSSFLLEYSKEVLLLERTLGNTHRGGMRRVLRMKQGEVHLLTRETGVVTEL